VTVAKWVLPGGDWINGKGITPETEVVNEAIDGQNTVDARKLSSTKQKKCTNNYLIYSPLISMSSCLSADEADSAFFRKYVDYRIEVLSDELRYANNLLLSL
jgi:C-terminal processing protease CtpA/Prc